MELSAGDGNGKRIFAKWLERRCAVCYNSSVTEPIHRKEINEAMKLGIVESEPVSISLRKRTNADIA